MVKEIMKAFSEGLGLIIFGIIASFLLSVEGIHCFYHKLMGSELPISKMMFNQNGDYYGKG